MNNPSDFFSKKPPAPDFSNVSGGSSTKPAATTGSTGSSPDFSNVKGGSSSTADKTYEVKSGDTLSKIAQREYGDANAWQKIFDANKGLLKDPDKIFPGQKLKIPPK